MLMVGIVDDALLPGSVLGPLNEKYEFVAAGLFGEGCKVMLCSLALRLLLNDDSRLACRLIFAVYSCSDSMLPKKLRAYECTLGQSNSELVHTRQGFRAADPRRTTETAELVRR